MIDILKSALGIGPKVDYKTLAKEGAVILDVPTESEFRGGHVKGSVNIPVDNLNGSLSKIKKDKAVITCCASGIRSAKAKSILQANGFKHVYNGGSWFSLQHKIS